MFAELEPNVLVKDLETFESSKSEWYLEWLHVFGAADWSAAVPSTARNTEPIAAGPKRLIPNGVASPWSVGPTNRQVFMTVLPATPAFAVRVCNPDA